MRVRGGGCDGSGSSGGGGGGGGADGNLSGCMSAPFCTSTLNPKHSKTHP